MNVDMTGPCEPWATDADLTVIGCDAADVDMAPWLLAASALLWKRTGRRYGSCEVVLRPCGTGHRGWDGRTVSVSGGFEWWWNGWGCGCGTACEPLNVILLPSPHVSAVTAVRVDGEELPAGAWRVDNGNRLRRLDGHSWPRCQNLNDPDSEPGTWSVTYLHGLPVPVDGRLAAAAWACHLAKTYGPAEGCGLPAGVVSGSRQSVDLEFVNAAEVLASGATGVELVDQFIAADNPHGHTRAARFLSPDGPRPTVPGTT